MIQAYRRGLLASSLPFGRRSRVRENLLLDALEAENLADATEKRMNVTTAMIGPAQLTKEGRQRLLRTFKDDIQRMSLVRLLDIDGANGQSSDNSALAIAQVYDMLLQSGVLSEPAK